MTDQASGNLVQVFTRPPIPGQVKTRLIPALGEQGAADLHAELASCVLKALETSDLDYELWCTSDIDHSFFDDFKVNKQLQQGNDLGERMENALNDGLLRASNVVLIGTDLPTLDINYLRKAFESLGTHQVTLGPADDGGYGLIGSSGVLPDVFVDVPWGHSEVLRVTCDRLNQARINYALLPRLWDVDMPEDLARYREWQQMVKPHQAGPGSPPRS